MAHPHGWGIGWYQDDDAYVVKSAVPAHACERFQQISGRIASETFLVHVRRATVGRLDPLNAHPFRYGRWMMAHNGTIFALERLRAWMESEISPALRAMVLGDTDSELLFFFLISRLEAAGLDRCGRRPSDPALVAEVVREGLWALDAEAIARGLPRPILNVLLTDGRLMMYHRAGMPLHMATQKLACPEAESCPVINKVCLGPARATDGRVTHLLVASEPIGVHDRWEVVADGASGVVDADFRWTPIAAPPGWTAPELPAEYKPFIYGMGESEPAVSQR